MNDIDQIIDKIIEFRNEREWEQFHNPKDLALALSIEAAELNQLFLWKSAEEADREQFIKKEMDKLQEKADKLKDDAKKLIECKKEKQIIFDKIEENAVKYPVNKSKGIAKKYTEL